MASIRFKLSTGDTFTREVESEEIARENVRSFFNRHDDYLGDWIKVDGDAYIARGAVVAVEVIADEGSAVQDDGG